MKIKILFSVIVFSLTFAVVSALKTNAAGLTGWLWGGTENPADATINGNETGIGWVSASNVSGGGAVAYSMDIPSDDGNLSGYAWSENIGWISFNAGELVGCPSGTCSARKVGTDLEGWARIMSISQAGANAGGWLGWVSLRGANYGVTISGASLSGYAWSDELGWIDFSRASLPAPPAITLSASPQTINIDVSPLPQNTTLTWSVIGATSCTASSGNGSWVGLKDSVGGAESVQITASMPTVDFTLSCTGPGGDSSQSVNVTTVCYEHSCGSSVCGANPKYSVSSSSACSIQDCVNDSQCVGISTGEWIEVAP